MSGYIMDMRKLVGHRAILQVGASVILEDAQGRVLLQKRTDNGCWGYHGGSVELDEPVEAAARRELLEETGLRAGQMALYGVFSGPEMHFVYPNGDEVSNVDVVFLCRDWSGQLQPQPEEIEALRFFAANALPEPLHPPNIPALTRWRTERSKN